MNLLYSIFKLVQPLFPKDTIITWDDLFEIHAEPIDGWTMFQYLQKNGIRSRYIINRDSPFYKKLKHEKNTGNIIAIPSSLKHSIFTTLFWTLLRVKAVLKPFVYNHNNPKSDKQLTANKYIQDVFVQHGVTFFKTYSAKMFNPNITNNIIVSNDMEKEIYRSIGNWSPAKLLPGGMCRWDALERVPVPRKKILIFFTWRGSLDMNPRVFDGRRKSEPSYHPIKSTYIDGIQSLLRNPRLTEIAKKYDLDIVLGVHHAAIDNAKLTLFDFFAPNVEMIDLQDVSGAIRSASMVITDRSSMIFDPMFLDTPVAFYTPDKNNPMLNKIEHGDEENAINLQKEQMYNYCNTADELVNKIESYAKNDFVLEEENKKINEKFFYYKKDICKHILETIGK